MERGLVLNAVTLDASGEVEQRFFLVQIAEGLRNVFDGEELAVGVDVVVFGFVRREGAGVFHLVGRARRTKAVAGALRAAVAVHGFEQQIFAGGKVLVERKRRIERDDGNQVRRMHLFVDVVAGSVLSANDIVGLHRGDVEEHDDEAVIAQLFLGSRAGLCAKDPIGRGGVDGGFVEGGGFVDVFKVEAGDMLRLAVLGNGEIFFGETLHGRAGLLVDDNDVGEDQIAVDLEGEGRTGIGGRLGLGAG